jgi:hypothetical protein
MHRRRAGRKSSTAERVLTQRELNRALLARQLLLARVRLPLPRAIERMGGIQAQYAPSAYLGLWSRVEGFERQQLTRALEQKRVVQGTLLRRTIHIVSRGDYWRWAEAIRESGHEWLLRVRPETMQLDLRRAERKLRAALRQRPRQRDELIDLIGREAWNGLEVDLVRVPPSGTWERRRADLYALAEDWIGPNDADVHDGRELLVRRYLGAFGPARPEDIRKWSGLGTEHVQRALSQLEPLRRFRDEQGKELVDLLRAPLPDSENPAPVRFLPTWDATLLVHARRTQILPEHHRERVFHVKTPHSVNTFLVDGQVAGKWRYENGRIALEPFARLSREIRRELQDEAERLAVFHA